MTPEAAQPAEPTLGICPFARRIGAATQLGASSLYADLPAECSVFIKESRYACANTIKRTMTGLQFGAICYMEHHYPEEFGKQVHAALAETRQRKEETIARAQGRQPGELPPDAIHI